MKTQELELINEMLTVINTKVNNADIQKYIEEHLCKLLNGNNVINDLTTGVEIYSVNNNDEIDEYFKLLFYPTENDFNFKNFSKIEIVYNCDNSKVEKKTLEFFRGLIVVNELQIISQKTLNKKNIMTTEKLLKRKYVKNSLLYNYQFISKISSDFLVPSYQIEEETFIDSKSSTTKSIIIIPKHSNKAAIRTDVKTTDTILAKYIDSHDLENVSFINSEYLVGTKFNTKEQQISTIPNNIILSATTSSAYQKLQRNLSKKI